MKKVIRTLLAVVLAMAFVLPMTIGASAEVTVAGYAQQKGYESNWVGSQIKPKYGIYSVAADGPYNGGVQWNKEADRITLDSETGVLTFSGINNPFCKFYPGQVQSPSTTTGAAMLQFDIFYDSGVTTVGEGLETQSFYNFSGINISYIQSTTDRTLISIDETGAVRGGNGKSEGFNALPFAQLAEGWNTIYIYFFPNETTENNTTTVTNNTVYARISNSENQYMCSESYGITTEELTNHSFDQDYLTNLKGQLKAQLEEAQGGSEPAVEVSNTYLTENIAENRYYYKFTYNVAKYFGGNGDAISMGSLLYMKPCQADKGEIKIRNVKCPNLIPDSSLYKVTYQGYDKLTAFIPTNASNHNITVSAASGVNYWVEDVVGGTARYYTPGDSAAVLDSMTLRPATAEEETIGSLGSAATAIDTNRINDYTYSDLNAAIAKLETAMAEYNSQKPDEVEESEWQSNGYYQLAITATEEISQRMGVIADACERLISKAAIFSDDTKTISKRLEAYDLVKDGTYDATYFSDLNGDRINNDALDKDGNPIPDERCKDAMLKLELFATIAANTAEDLKAYEEGLTALENADATTDLGAIISGMLVNVSNIRQVISNFEIDQLMIDKYQENLENRKTAYFALTTVAEKYQMLLKWFEEYNLYKKVMTGERRKADIPQQLLDAVNDYNAMIGDINADCVEALILSGMMQYEAVNTADIATMLTDIKSKVEALLPTEE